CARDSGRNYGLDSW
nr:immunoglobulin heavy chain junction region [Macaca mulatta]MOV52790.1 immunoglobulin heavy chain junction region [Macaca mulatta]